MTATREQHLAFWTAVEAGLAGGTPALDLLRQVGQSLSDTPFADAAPKLVDAVENGARLSDALEKQPGLFAKTVCVMTRAGEAGGVLDVIAGRIAKALDDGSFAPPGVQPDPGAEQERYWRALGWMISSGVPILQAFTVLREEIATGRLAEATEAVHSQILEGGTVAAGMRDVADLFDAQVCDAVQAGEEQGTLDEIVFKIADALKAGDLDTLPKPTPDATPTQDAAPVVKVVNRILLTAFKERASDIHIDPNEDGTARVRLRVDGVLRDIDPLPADLANAVVGRVKIMAAMDVAERRLPQDGRIMVETEGRKLDLRVSTVPTLFGERICTRLLSRQHASLELDQLGLSQTDLAAVRDLANQPHGIILANGPTGCGKTTLMYSMLHEMDRDKCCVCSVEDPVEYTIDGVAQIAVRPQVGLTFARALRSVLRQDPDAVMIGEIRDFETLIVCVQTALTGHLVISSLHATDGPGAVRRMIDIGLEPFLVNSTLLGVVSPRLVRVLCDKCKRPAPPPVHSIPPRAQEFVRSHPDATFFEPVGCDACVGGYHGRTAIYEVLQMDDKVRDAVHSAPDTANIRNAALASGMKPMVIDGLEKAEQGITSIREVCRVSSP